MTVERLAVAVLLCAGLGAAKAGAGDAGRPVSVPVPVSGKTPVLSPPNPKPKPMDAAGPQEASPAAAEEDVDPLQEEEYLPLDLPPGEDDPANNTQEAEDTGQSPAAEVEPAVLGLEPEPSGDTFYVHAEILGVPSGAGVVSASLCTRKTFTKSGCRTERVTAREGQVSVTFSDVAPGSYAIQVHHDQNGNSKMDFTFFGLPKEPYGFSRDAKPMLAPPKFDSASFEVTGSDVSLVIHLQNT